jgi:hypothetical protein
MDIKVVSAMLYSAHWFPNMRVPDAILSGLDG